MIELLNEVTDEGNLLQRFAKSDRQKWNQLSFNDFLFSRVEEHRKTYSFCGDYIPGPLIPSASAKALLLAFRSDEKDAASGFQLRFQFLPKSRLFPRNEGRKDKIFHFCSIMAISVILLVISVVKYALKLT